MIFRFILALVITLSAAYYQRKTGPTYPLSGETIWQNSPITYELDRSHGGAEDQPVEIIIPDNSIDGYLFYKRYKSSDKWKAMQMERVEDRLAGILPHQPPAGKIEYFILLKNENEYLTIPNAQTVVTRFKGDVPAGFLIPHILFMFVAMLFSTAAGLEALSKGKSMEKFTMITTVLLFIGGIVLGSIVQKFAFGVFWSGLPWGMDLTDNKFLIAMIVWILAFWKAKNKNNARTWIIIASITLILVYTIPHSTIGSELNYNTMQLGTGD